MTWTARELRTGALMLTVVAVVTVPSKQAEGPAGASPLYGVTIPAGYRTWALVAPALEGAPLDELRAVLGNELALSAYRERRRSSPCHMKSTAVVSLGLRR
jgi:hypothetical protein